MEKTECNQALVQACNRSHRDLDEIRALLLAGADPNLQNECGFHIFDYVFSDALCDCLKRDRPIIVEKIKQTMQTAVEHGWDIKGTV